ncbi:MAG: DUF1015 family protein [Clostridia bacterium]|nr:DUF1015 family protein [Clostridia bacterium]
MKSCIRIPRILIPARPERHWSVVACDQFTSDRAYWERVKREVGARPSTMHFILPEAYLGEEDEERIREIHVNMHLAMTDEWMVKLDRGLVLTERSTSTGIRRGILACIDLEEYTFEKGVVSTIRSSEEVVKERLPARVALRRGALLEFPHAILFYKDKKDALMRWILSEEMECLYDYDLLEGGGRLKGYFIPEEGAVSVVRDLYSRGTPCFAVADGNHSVAAAKAYWEEVKSGLSEREQKSHPARFMLVEFVNIYDSSVCFYPIHRLVKEVDAEAFISYFCKHVKCKREGNVLIPALAGGAPAVSKTDELIEEYLRANTGKVDYIHGDEELFSFAKEENSVGIMLAPMEKEDFFAQLKKGNNLPKKTFSLGEGREKRYYTEGREIRYD